MDDSRTSKSIFDGGKDFTRRVLGASSQCYTESSLGKRKASDVPENSESVQPNKFHKTIPDDDSLSSNEEPVVIARYPQLSGYFKNLRYGVAWEIARLLSLRSDPPEITMEALKSLSGSNAESAPKAIKVILGQNHDDTDEVDAFKDAFAKETSAKLPWEELDREEDTLRADPCAGLGFNEDYPGWYGGKVQFTGRLKDTSSTKTPNYTVRLDRPVLGPSCRFGRRFGSHNILKIKLPKNIVNKSNNRLLEFFMQPFVIHDNIFRTFYAKDHNIFLFRTNEGFSNSLVITPTSPLASSGSMSLMDFLNWHNPLEYNSKQAMTKWASRFSLGLSTSVPGLRLEPSDIIKEDDTISAPPESSEMTDGCGLINRSALLSLRLKYDWATFPTAIQCRLDGAKGLLCLHHDDTENHRERPRVRLRPSQIKIHHQEDVHDPATLIIDVLQSSHMRTPARLSAETLTNLAENGVPHHVFIKLLRDGLEEQVAGLITWDGPDAMFNLWCAVSRAGGVMMARMAREFSGEARARGYRLREMEDLELDDEDALEEPNLTHQRSTAWWADVISGCPSTLEETVMVLLDSGFTPQNSAILRGKLHAIVKKTINAYVLKYTIDVPMSCSALLVPDTRGVLAPDEIHIKSSRRNFKIQNGVETEIITGDVLITRNPCKLPTDIQKVKAVYKPELADLVDVIVCPISGYRRFAELLAGGDYDGDKGVVFYDPDIVRHFRNADIKYSYEPEGLADNFARNTEMVSDVLQRIRSVPPIIQLRELQKFLLGAIRDTSIVGKYSSFHDYAIYVFGYDHPDTIRLNYMFCSVLDAIKTGRTILPEVVRADSSKFQRRPPMWKETKEEIEKLQMKQSNEANPIRPSNLRPFIMDTIHRQAKKLGDLKHAQAEQLFSNHFFSKDPHLTAPWENAVVVADRAKREHNIDKLNNDLEAIQQHVDNVYKMHKARMQMAVDQNKAKAKKKDKVSSFTDLPIEVRQDVLRASAREFASKPLPKEVLFSEEEIAKLRASWAYIYDAEQEKMKASWSRFPWDVAMRELCNIKAHAVGPTKTVTENFYARYYMKQTSSSRA